MIDIIKEEKRKFKSFAYNSLNPSYFTLDEISETVNGCPMCILTIFRLAGLNRYYFEQAGLKYDYKKDIAELWDSINADRRETQEYYNY